MRKELIDEFIKFHDWLRKKYDIELMYMNSCGYNNFSDAEIRELFEKYKKASNVRC